MQSRCWVGIILGWLRKGDSEPWEVEELKENVGALCWGVVGLAGALSVLCVIVSGVVSR